MSLCRSILYSMKILNNNNNFIKFNGLFQCQRSLAVTGRHSKNVAGKKNKLDAIKQKLYNRLAVKIFMAAKVGTDPSTNKELSRALKEAKDNKLPKENIERAISKASGKEAIDITSGIYEVFGYASTGIIVVTLTDNNTRANKTIKAVVNKHEGIKMASSGSVLFQFNHKGVFKPNNKKMDDDTMDLILTKAIDNDINVDFENDNSDIITDPDTLDTLTDIMNELDITGSSSLGYIPNSKVDINDDDIEKNSNLIDDIEELEDVDQIFHNMNNM